LLPALNFGCKKSGGVQKEKKKNPGSLPAGRL